MKLVDFYATGSSSCLSSLRGDQGSLNEMRLRFEPPSASFWIFHTTCFLFLCLCGQRWIYCQRLVHPSTTSGPYGPHARLLSWGVGNDESVYEWKSVANDVLEMGWVRVTRHTRPNGNDIENRKTLDAMEKISNHHLAILSLKAKPSCLSLARSCPAQSPLRLACLKPKPTGQLSEKFPPMVSED